ncbi:MAG: polyphosphate kinase 2 family protein [Rhodocyclaceae bacterium]|nr:polyphosphate kinase 2 family protein [Rhodocyclaceae bacterium]
MGLAEKLRVGRRGFSIDSQTAAVTPGALSEKAAISATEKIARKIRALQLRLYAEGRQSLLIVLQGLDAAGKDGTIKHVLGMMNPQGCTVTGFKQPTPLELRHDFLWRIHPHVPGKGEIAIFNRSHYEDVLITRVHELCPKSQINLRYEQINQFESLLSTQASTRIIKFFLHISREEQLARFAARLDDPAKNWKISDADYAERQHWDAYREAYEFALRKTSTPDSPWFVIPSDNKWYRNFAVANIVLETLEAMAPRIPKPSVNLDTVRQEFHNAVLQEIRMGRVKSLAKAMDKVVKSRDQQLQLADLTLAEIHAIGREARKRGKKS